MNYFPVCLNINKKKCVVVGGGKVGERKALALLECGAEVRVVSPALTKKLEDLQDKGFIEWRSRGYEEGDLEGAFLVIAATDAPEVQDAVRADAERRNMLINVADVPEKCNFILPATFRRGGLAVSVSTSGKSPALARKLRQRLEDEFGAEYEILVDLLGELRPRILAMPARQQDNDAVFRELIGDEVLDWIRRKDWRRIENNCSRLLGEAVELDCLTNWKKKD